MTATIDDDSVWFSVVMPTAGSILGFFLGFAAVPTMMNDRKVGKLSVDPVPYPVAFTTCFAWCFYGTVIGDPWPFVGNILPVLGNAFCVITALRLCDDPRTAAMTEWITIGGILLLLVLLLVCVSDFVIKDHTRRGTILGNTCVHRPILLSLYRSPEGSEDRRCAQDLTAFGRHGLAVQLLLVGLRPNGGPVGHMDSERRRLRTRWRSLHGQALRLEAQRRTTGENGSNGSPRGDHPRAAMSLIHVLGGDAHQITPSGTAFVCPHFSIFIHCIFTPFSVNTPKVEPLEHEGLPRRTPNYWRPTPLLYT